MDGPLRVGIVGSRRRNTLYDRKAVFRLVAWLVQRQGEGGLVIVSGGCPKGADNFAEEAARIYDVATDIYPVDTKGVTSRWEFRKRAFARNRVVAERSTELYCWVAEDRKGGTENTVGHALELKRPVYLVDGTGDVYLSTETGGYPRCAPVVSLFG